MKQIKYFLAIIIISLSWLSCESYLDLSPENQLDEAAVFSTYENARGYLDICTQLLHCNVKARGSQTNENDFNNGSGDYLASFTDEAASNNGRIKNSFVTGEWLGLSVIQEVGESSQRAGTIRGMIVPNSFYAVRVANKTLENVSNMTNLTEKQRNELIGQAHFYRAWYYFQIIRRWGGFALLDKAFDTDDNYDLERLPYQECTDWMLKDIDKAIELLPDRWSEDQVGRPDKASAHAIKGMVTLYAASPLMNNPVGVIQDNGYSKEYCELAARYAHDAIEYVRSQGRDLAGLELTANGIESADSAAVAQNYQNIFYHNISTGQFVSDDALFYANTTGQDRDGGNPSTGTNADISRTFMNRRFSYRGGGFGVGFSSPTQNIADKFEVIANGNAYPVTDPRSGYSLDNPFANRDPRFYNNFLVPGGRRSIPNGGPHWFEPWEGGDDYAPPGEVNEAVGGYLCIKWWWNNYTITTSGTHCYNHAFVRTAQLYLDYAEAMNEAYGPRQDPEGYGLTAVEAINLVRRRAGMVPVLDEFTVNAATFGERIRNERAVELFWEGHRWFDIRRWMIFDEVFQGTNPMRALRTTDATDYEGMGITNPDLVEPENKNLIFTVEEITTETRSYTERNYWYPIFKSHMERLNVTQQNPGW